MGYVFGSILIEQTSEWCAFFQALFYKGTHALFNKVKSSKMIVQKKMLSWVYILRFSIGIYWIMKNWICVINSGEDITVTALFPNYVYLNILNLICRLSHDNWSREERIAGYNNMFFQVLLSGTHLFRQDPTSKKHI